MDDYMFKYHVQSSKQVHEITSYLEIFSYSDPKLNTVEEHALKEDEFHNFLHRKGVFERPKLPDGVTMLGGMRLILQQKAKHPDTFAPGIISLKPAAFVDMVETLYLPYRGIESSSAVGPLFWSAFDQDEENPHLQILYRKSDVRKKGLTRGWELSLSYEMNTGLTTGFCKGTSSSDIEACIVHLKACSLQIGHPLLLPTIIFSHDMSAKTDIKQREARDWLRRLEHAVSMRTEIEDKESYVDKDGLVDFDLINRHLVECHSQVLWKRPTAYIQIVEGFTEAFKLFEEGFDGSATQDRWRKDLRMLNKSMQSRMQFYKKKLQGIDSYAHTTLQRLEIQRSALYSIIAQREGKLNFHMAGEQRKLVHAAKRDSEGQRTIALLGIIFLPGTLLASVFSMTFFNFQTDPDSTDMVAPTFWIYWAITIPTTFLIMGIFYFWTRHRTRKYIEEDIKLERSVEDMEIQIQSAMRKRTMNKVATWNKQNGGEKNGGGD